MTNLIAGLMMPVPVILGLLLIGLLLQSVRLPVAGFVCVLLGTVGLAAMSLPAVPEMLLEPLESRYDPLAEPPDADWVVVLGGGAIEATDRPSSSRLSDSSRARLVEGIRLARMLPEARVAFSGRDAAEAMAEAAWGLGFELDTIELFSEAETTAAEARAAAEHIDPEQSIILVTSAFHMPRAVELFTAQGLTVIPAPAGHLIDPGRRQAPAAHQLPQAQYLRYAERALWERLGVFWARLIRQS